MISETNNQENDNIKQKIVRFSNNLFKNIDKFVKLFDHVIKIL